LGVCGNDETTDWRDLGTPPDDLLFPVLPSMIKETSSLSDPVLSLTSTNTMYIKYETVFHEDVQAPRKEFKIKHAAEYF